MLTIFRRRAFLFFACVIAANVTICNAEAGTSKNAAHASFGTPSRLIGFWEYNQEVYEGTPSQIVFNGDGTGLNTSGRKLLIATPSDGELRITYLGDDNRPTHIQRATYQFRGENLVIWYDGRIGGVSYHLVNRDPSGYRTVKQFADSFREKLAGAWRKVDAKNHNPECLAFASDGTYTYCDGRRQADGVYAYEVLTEGMVQRYYMSKSSGIMVLERAQFALDDDQLTVTYKREGYEPKIDRYHREGK